MKTVLITIIIFALFMLILGLGLILSGKCIRLGCQAERSEPGKTGDESLVCPRCERDLARKRR